MVEAETSRARWVRERLAAIVMAAVGVPILVYAIVCSLRWFALPFPGFFVMENAVVPTVSSYDWPAHRQDLFHARVLAVDGAPVHSSGEVYDVVAQRPVGTPFAYTFAKDGEVVHRTVASIRFTGIDYLENYGILLLIGTMNVLTGVAVGFMQPHLLQARVYLLLCITGGIFSTTAVFLHQPHFAFMSRLYLFGESFFPATFVHFALVFPVERRFVGWRRFVVVAPYVLSTFLWVAALRGFFRDPPILWALYGNYLFHAASYLIFVAAMIFAYREHREPMVRLPINSLLIGVSVSAVLAIPMLANNAIGGGTFPMQLGLLSVPLFYASLTYAILRHELFDIDRVVRQSFVYGTLSMLVIVAYALVLLIPSRLTPAFAENQAVIQMAFVLGLALGLDPLRRGVQRVVDRAFYRTRLDYRATIGELSDAMTTLLDLRAIVERVTGVPVDSMHLESTSLCFLGRIDEPMVFYTRRKDGAIVERIPDAPVAALRDVLGRHTREWNPGRVAVKIDDLAVRERVLAFFKVEGTSVVFPLLVQGRAIGFLMLGPKRSGRSFDSDDVALLRTLANQTAVAIENASSYRALSDLTQTLDEKVRVRTDQLHVSNQSLREAYDELKEAQARLVQAEKMASLGLLVAGVAHEINNPVSFIVANLKPLQSRMAALRSLAMERADAPLVAAVERVSEVLEIVGRGAERTAGIVQDLRTFSRPGEGASKPVDPHECLDVTLRLLRPKWADRIKIHREYGELPAVEAVPAEINQVFMNVLANACDAVEGTGNIWITTGSRDGNVVFTIRDDGAGIADADLAHIFEPFFTTKEIGQGSGLGLAISHGLVARHGGTIEVVSSPDKGTTFTIVLPSAQPAEVASR